MRILFPVSLALSVIVSVALIYWLAHPAPCAPLPATCHDGETVAVLHQGQITTGPLTESEEAKFSGQIPLLSSQRYRCQAGSWQLEGER